MSKSDDGPGDGPDDRPNDRSRRLRVLITYDGTDDSSRARGRRAAAGRRPPLLRAIAGGSAAPGRVRARTARLTDLPAALDAARFSGLPRAGRDQPHEPPPLRAPVLPGETIHRLAELAHELHEMSNRLRQAACRIEGLVQAMTTLQGFADDGPEALIDSLEEMGLMGDEMQSTLALLSLLAEGPEESRSDQSISGDEAARPVDAGDVATGADGPAGSGAPAAAETDDEHGGGA